MTILVDTSVLVDALNDRRARRQFLEQMLLEGHTLASCTIVVAEVYAGMRPKEAKQTAEWLAALEFVETSQSTAKLGGELKAAWARKGRTLSLSDSLIAAVAIEHGLALATDNLKDFPMPQLTLLNVPKPQ